MTIYFTSDPHYWHANVIRYCSRPSTDVQHMNQALVDNWNAVVQPDDTVYCLGDFSLAFRPVETITSRLMGRKLLVPGNHDWCHPAHKKGRGSRLAGTIAKYEELGWEVLPIHSELEVPGVGPVNLCHLPYLGDNTDDRYADYRMRDDGRWLLCGHVHEKWRTKGRMINVGVDVWDYRPVSLDQILEIMAPSH